MKLMLKDSIIKKKKITGKITIDLISTKMALIYYNQYILPSWILHVQATAAIPKSVRPLRDLSVMYSTSFKLILLG